MGTAQEYDVETGRGYSVITFQACLSDCKWGDIERVGTELKALLSGAADPFCLLDLSRLDFMGSSVVALLVRVWKTIQERQGGMVVVNPNTMTKEVLEIAGLSKVWTICNSRPEAEKELAKVLPADTRIAGVLAALFGWTIAGLTVAALVAHKNGAFTLEPVVVQGVGYGGSAIALFVNLIAIVKGGGAWRFFGVLGTLLAAGLIAAVAMNLF